MQFVSRYFGVPKLRNISGEIPGKVDNFSLSARYSKHPLVVKLKCVFFFQDRVYLLHFFFNSPEFSNNLDLKTFQGLRKHLKRTNEGAGSKSVLRQEDRKQWIVFKHCRPEAQCSVCSVLHAGRKCPLKNVRKMYDVLTRRIL